MKVFCDTCGEMLVYHEDKKGNVESYCLKCETAALPTPNLGLPVMTKECDQRMCTLLRRIEKLERHVHYLPPVEVRPGDPTGVQQEHLEQPATQQQPRCGMDLERCDGEECAYFDEHHADICTYKEQPDPRQPPLCIQPQSPGPCIGDRCHYWDPVDGCTWDRTEEGRASDPRQPREGGGQ